MLLPTGIRFESFATEGRYIHTWPQATWLVGFAARARLVPHAVGPLCHRRADRDVHHPDGRLWLAGNGRHGRADQRRAVGLHGRRRLCRREDCPSYVPFWLAIPPAACGRRGVASLFALPAIRVKGFYLALTTLAAQVMFPIIVLGAARRMARRHERHGGRADRVARAHALVAARHLLLHARRRVVICSVGAFNLQRSRFGRALLRGARQRPGRRGHRHRRSYVQGAWPSSPVRCSPASPARFFAYYIRYRHDRELQSAAARSGISAC